MTQQDDFESVVRELHNCQKEGTHEYAGMGEKPVKRRETKKHKCGTLIFEGTRRVLCDECSKSLARRLGILDP